MEQVPPDGEKVSSDSSEELDSYEGTPWHHPSRCCHSDSISQAEEESEDGEELTGEPTEELIKELTEGPTKEPTVGCPTSG